MFIASQKGHLDTVEILASSHRASIDQADHQGVTALYGASQNGHSAVVKVLLEHRADPNRTANNGCTPLMASTTFGHTDVCRCLIKYGAKIDAVCTFDCDDWSPIMFAKAGGHTDTVALLERRLIPCAHCGNTAQQSGVHEKMKVCSLCRSVHYCSKQCSHAAWVAGGGGHSKECKRLGTEKRGLAAWLAAKRRQREPKQNRKQQPKQKAAAAAPAPSAPSASAPSTSTTPIQSISSDSRCANCGKTAAAKGLPQLLRCSKCKSVAYCGAACQRVHWKAGGHKAACKKIRNNQQSAAADE